MNQFQDLGDGYYLDPSTGDVYDPTTNSWVPPVSTITTADATNVAAQAQQAASAGTDVTTFTNDLLKLGYTAAQLVTLFQNVKTSQQATPQMLQYLAQANATLQQSTQTSFNVWLGVGVAIGAIFLLSDR